MVNLLELAD